MIVNIITINRNNATGLEKTMQSVFSQTCRNFEYIIVDGASTDTSVQVIQRFAHLFGDRLKWVSESDSGIYNAMNKGLKMASGQYVEFLNSGDYLASGDVIERVLAALGDNGFPSILYGNMNKSFGNGVCCQDKGFAGKDISFLMFYKGTMNHPSAFIRKDLFDKYGQYDETLKIVSDWKWFLQAIALGEEEPVYADIDVSVFDMNGISESNQSLASKERKIVLDQLIPKRILVDYEEWSFPISQIRRLKRHPWAYKIVWFLDRVLFKIEKLKR